MTHSESVTDQRLREAAYSFTASRVQSSCSGMSIAAAKRWASVVLRRSTAARTVSYSSSGRAARIERSGSMHRTVSGLRKRLETSTVRMDTGPSPPW